MSELAEGRIARARRERMLASFVDRTAEMTLFQSLLDTDAQPVMVVSAASGMGKTALMLRMLHECALRDVSKAVVTWTDLDVLDYMAVMRKLRDALDAKDFSAFTDLISYYTDSSHQLQVAININLQGGTVEVARGLQISGGSSVGDSAGVVLRDNMFVVQRPDLAEPLEVRCERLTERFLQGLKQFSTGKQVVLFFESTEKMSEINYQWLLELLLKPVIDGQLPNVRAVLLGQRPLPVDRDIISFLTLVELKPLAVEDIAAYIAKRAAATGISADVQRELARMLAAMTLGRPADVATAVDLYLASRSAA